MKGLNLELKPEMVDLSKEERIEVCKERLKKLHPQYEGLRKELSKISDDITYYANLKYVIEMSLITIVKVKPFDKPLKRARKSKGDIDMGKLIKQLSGMSESDKERLTKELTKN